MKSTLNFRVHFSCLPRLLRVYSLPVSFLFELITFVGKCNLADLHTKYHLLSPSAFCPDSRHVVSPSNLAQLVMLQNSIPSNPGHDTVYSDSGVIKSLQANTEKISQIWPLLLPSESSSIHSLIAPARTL